MKIKYLPVEDRQALHKLKNIQDPCETAAILNEAHHRSFTLQTLWEYRKYYERLGEEHFRKYPILAAGYSHILAMSGRLKEAKEVLDAADASEAVQLYAKLALPNATASEREECISEIRRRGLPASTSMVITCGRPSVINGAWDVTAISGRLETDKEEILEHLTVLYGEQAELIYEVALAEVMYYQNKCYDALVRVVSLLPLLREKQDMRLLFVALTLEVFIMVVKNHAPSTKPMLDNLRQQISSVGLEEYLPNIDALEAWAAMYDGDYAMVARWMREGSPDEYGRFCMLDTFRYMVKMRAYIIQGKYLSVTALAQRLMPLLESAGRHMDCCELHMLWAMSDHADGRTYEAMKHLRIALELSERYRYDRLLADEGKRMYDLLKLYRTEENDSPYLRWIMDLADHTAAQFPRYLKNQLPDKPELTPTELRVLRLLAEEYSNGQICEEMDIALDTVKSHCRNLFQKLEVKKRSQAVQRAIEFGIIEPAVKGAVPRIEESRKKGTSLGTILPYSTKYNKIGNEEEYGR